MTLMVLGTMAILKGGVVFHNWIVLTDAARAGARVLSISRVPGLNACDLARDAFFDAAATIAGQPTVNVSVAGSCTNISQGSDATVTATLPCDMKLLGPAGSACVLRASSTMRVE
jgi:Flp pilus assembly protein TadG